MSKLLVILIVIALPIVAIGQTLSKVNAEGHGDTESQALDAAKRIAVEKSIGTIVSSQVITRNYTLASDKIFSRAAGFLKSYRIIESGKIDEGYSVLIEAEVTEVLDDLTVDLIALEQLIQWMDKPRFMVIMSEENMGESTNNCQIEISRILAEQHIDLVTAVEKTDVVRELSQYDLSEASALASRYGAEMLLIGNARAQLGKKVKALEKSAMESAQAEVAAQIVDVRDGNILASYAAHGAAIHIAPLSAGALALREAAGTITDSLMILLLKYGGKAQLAARQITLKVVGIDFEGYSAILDILLKIDGISYVHERAFNEPEAEIGVEYFGKTMHLAKYLNGAAFGECRLKVVEVAGNTLTIEVQR